MDNLFVPGIRIQLCNKLYRKGLDLPHCKCIRTKQPRAQPPATCLLQDMKLTTSVLGREDKAKALCNKVQILSHAVTFVTTHNICADITRRKAYLPT